MENTLNVYTDGGSRGNPGHAAYGITILDPQGHTLHQLSGYLGITTNNQAEYQGVVQALRYFQQNLSSFPSLTQLKFFLDSELIVRQITGVYRIKDAGLQVHATLIHQLLDSLPFQVTFTHVPRSQNKLADALVNQTLDQLGH